MTRLAHQPSPPSPTEQTPTVALVGNPNTGKSTLFNRLTGIRQRTGNYPGVTVERRLGATTLAGDRSATVIDLPGTYSLAASSVDERVVVDVLANHVPGTPRPDVAVCIADGTNLLRHLFLASQVAETGVPVVIAVNMIDAAEAQGIAIDAKLLRDRLGVPVVKLCATRGRGIDELRDAIDEALSQRPVMHNLDWPPPVLAATDYLRNATPAAANLTRAELLRLLFDEESAVAQRVGWSAAQRTLHVDQARAVLRDGGLDSFTAEPLLRYGYLATAVAGVVTRPAQRQATGTESIDRILTHRLWGLVVFTLLMYSVFWAIYTGAAPLMDGIDAAFTAVGGWVGGMLAPWPLLQSLATQGLIAGVGGVVVFLPQILILFFFISLLEDTGYMARAAFLMDRLFAWCGLNGKSFVPLLGSFACAIPGVMGARTIDNPRSRLTTILIAPLMSCSARLPVYVLLIGAFIEPKYGAAVAAAVLFAMHMVGLVVALPIALIVNRFIFKVKRTPFVLEMPAYRVPDLRDAFWRMWNRSKDFVTTAGTVIVAMSIIIWALSYFPRPEGLRLAASAAFVQELAASHGIDTAGAATLAGSDAQIAKRLEAHIDGAYLEQSYLGRLGRFVQPVFAPAGFDWKITIGVLASFPAREVIIATLGITYNVGGEVDEANEGLIGALRAAKGADGAAVFTVPVAAAIMVFFALCMQCGSTLAVIGREAGWRYSALSFAYMTALAWVGAVVTYQVGTWLCGGFA